ncbi:MAG: sensor histidine kinase [Anaerolineae bacterium]|nr:sensor histidine kinase [Anaerolineae bacterium]
MSDLLRDFLGVNRPIIFFIYGQVFFVLGLAIASQYWRHSRLRLARSLKWLAAFGFTHGLHEWGDLFIPIQAQYMPTPIVNLLYALQLLLLAASFTCLFQFGVETLRPLPPRQRWIRYLPGLVLVLWLFWALGPSLTRSADVTEWYILNNIWARYSMGFPGALLAAYGLRRQAHELITPLQTPQVLRTLRVAGLALAGYGLLGGLAVPPGDFFPANWFNSVRFEQLTFIPVQVFRGLLGLTLTLAIIRAMEVFHDELDRRIRSMEELQMLVTERERIGRELHDSTLQTIYAAGLLLGGVAKELVKTGSPQNTARLQQSIELLNQAVADIRGYIGALRPQSSSQSLAAGLEELARAQHLRSLVEINLALNLPEGKALSPTQVGHLLTIANEALSNVARHAHATHVLLSATTVDDRLRLEIKDNGHGLPEDYVVGYGLRNMQDRARILGGDMSLESRPGQGTIITIEVPWNEVNGSHSSAAG